MGDFVAVPRALNNLVILNVLMVSFVGLACGVFLYSFAGLLGVIVPVILTAFLSYLFVNKGNK